MRYVLTGAQARAVDRDTAERIGIPSLVLMERAALAVADAVCGLAAGMARPGPSVWVACGMGNNGADGIAAGRILKERGYMVTLILAGDQGRATAENLLQQQIAKKLGVPAAVFPDLPQGACDVVVDALFGVGLGREIGGVYQDLIAHLDSLARDGVKVVAVDIPSGVHADTGRVLGCACRADRTVTFGFEKIGLLLYPGRSLAGEVTVADIGLSRQSLAHVGTCAGALEPGDLIRLPKRRPDGNKGSFGKVLLVAGSEGMSGAAYLSALAAYRTGAGLVKILTVEANRAILQAQLPEAIVTAFKPEGVEAFIEFEGGPKKAGCPIEGRRLEARGRFREFIRDQCGWADVIVMGPGLGQRPYVAELVEAVLEHSHVTTVLDADGLNTVAGHGRLVRYLAKDVVVTPHIGEMSRLTGLAAQELKADPIGAAREYSERTGAVCLLKDAVSVVTDKAGRVYLNTSGCSAMAKAGSGDVLAGVVGALAAQGMEGVEAAAYGAYIHGCAGEAAAGALGSRGVLAHDIADRILEHV